MPVTPTCSSAKAQAMVLLSLEGGGRREEGGIQCMPMRRSQGLCLDDETALLYLRDRIRFRFPVDSSFRREEEGGRREDR